MATNHFPHIDNARKALASFEAAKTGGEIGERAVKVASALRTLLYEPQDGHQGDFVTCISDCCVSRVRNTEQQRPARQASCGAPNCYEHGFHDPSSSIVRTHR